MYLCGDCASLFEEPHRFTVDDDAYIECPKCGNTGFEEFTTGFAVEMLCDMWGAFKTVPGAELLANRITAILDELHNVEVGGDRVRT